MEIDGSDNIVRRYTYALDLAGLNGSVNSLEAAGTIGGLLAVDQAETGGGVAGGGVDSGDYLYFYDANGNVGQLIDYADGVGSATDTEWDAARIVAHYEYDPYGNRTNTPATGEYDQPFRFSTHQFDAETGMLYAKMRYYLPSLGRWLNRDPIGESDGLHLYAYVYNEPVNAVDPLGLWRDSDIVNRHDWKERRARTRESSAHSTQFTMHFDPLALATANIGVQIPVGFIGPIPIMATATPTVQTSTCCHNDKSCQQVTISVQVAIKAVAGTDLSSTGGRPRVRGRDRNKPVTQADVWSKLTGRKVKAKHQRPGDGGITMPQAGFGGSAGASTESDAYTGECREGVSGKIGVFASGSGGVVFGASLQGECSVVFAGFTPKGVECTAAWHAGIGYLGLAAELGGFGKVNVDMYRCE